MKGEPGPKIVRDYVPGVIGRVTELHATYYARRWGFGRFFETKVATEFSAFVQRYDRRGDGLWAAVLGGRVEGAVIIDGRHADTDGAHLRWFIVSEALRGRGVGRRLIRRAIGFCDRQGYAKTYLWTFEGLDAARHLYEEAGFRLLRQQAGTQWGSEVNEQYFERSLP